jgi:2-hydroxy-6-oxonona-2,4-dienedioate hydrolase
MIQYPIEADGVVTRVLEVGDGPRNMLLLHGVGARADRWRKVMPLLADAGYRVVAPDLPGHGLAHKGVGPEYTVPGYARFLRSFLTASGLDTSPCVVVGTSLGGHVSAMMTCDHPEIVSALVLVGSIGLVPWGEERRAATRNRLADASRETVERKLNLLVFDPALVTEEWIREECLINGSPGAHEAFSAIGAYIADRLDDDLITDRLAALGDRVPLQLVWGAEERSVAVEIGVAAHAMLPSSEFVLLPETAHAPFFERPEAFADHVLEFLRRRLP